ncbi:MAG TPA: RcpC/CpaB family pilus assembly protein [Actinomycetota bacterium]
MKGRGLVVFLALVMATLATVGVFLYTQNADKGQPVGEMVAVVVSNVDIPGNTNLNVLITDDQFKIIQVPEVAVVEGAVTSVDQLRDKTNSLPILAGEQIPVARIQGEGTVPGGALGIPNGHEAITVSVDAPRAVAGAIGVGDNLTVYGTYTGFQTPAGKKIPTMTSVLVPLAEVLAVYQPNYGDSGTLGTSGSQRGSGTISMTLALTPVDAQRMVFTMETGRVWFGLLPPNADGTQLQKITFVQVIK